MVAQYKVAVANVVAAAFVTVISNTGLRIFALGVVGKLTWEDISRYLAQGHVLSLACGLCGLVVAAVMACSGAVLQGVKEGGEKPRRARTADKAGWIKKSSGGLLGLWKDRYLLLCQAQLLVYENEVRTCLALRLGLLGQGTNRGQPRPAGGS